VTILVVDDDLATRALAEAVLHAEGFQVCPR
jgi:CheY-like chemotaxis protein